MGCYYYFTELQIQATKVNTAKYAFYCKKVKFNAPSTKEKAPAPFFPLQHEVCFAYRFHLHTSQ